MKTQLKRMLYSLGYEVKRISNNASSHQPPGRDLFSWLRTDTGIKTLIDIGANNGDYGQFLAKLLNVSSYYGIEPLPDLIPLIEQKLCMIKNVKIYNAAVSDHKGTANFYVNSYAPASSLLRVSEISKTEFPQTSREESTEVQIERLDDLVIASSLEKNIIVKIDVQGMEDKVIEGGRKLLATAKYILIEMSFLPIYDKQPLFEEVHALLVEIGYRFRGIKNQVNSEKTGQPLFCHCLYVNCHLR